MRATKEQLEKRPGDRRQEVH